MYLADFFENQRQRNEICSQLIEKASKSYFGDSFWPKKSCWSEKVHLALTFSKIRLDIC